MIIDRNDIGQAKVDNSRGLDINFRHGKLRNTSVPAGTNVRSTVSRSSLLGPDLGASGVDAFILPFDTTGKNP